MMTLEEYDVKVKPHLEFIRAGAEMASRHARSLPIKPNFETKAEFDLVETRRVLTAALADIEAAQTAYASKPSEQPNAA